MTTIVAQVAHSALAVYLAVLFGYVILSWVPRPPEPLVPIRLGLGALVDPVVAPIRRRLPPLRIGGIALDLSIILVFIGVRLLMSAIAALA